MASAAFELIAHLEVVLRNAIDTTLAAHFREADHGIPWFMRRGILQTEAEAQIESVRDKLAAQHRESRHQIIAGLSFGFWTGMLGTKYEELWRSALRKAFPGSGGSRKQVVVEFDAIRKFRNRIAHHDSMLNVDLPFEIRRILRAASFLGPEVAAWLNSNRRWEEVYASRPDSPLETVVVPARDAWPLYQDTRAYVCQSGRWFRPVERLAFYVDREVKPDIPKILHRRDDVLWTSSNASALLKSDDRNDRKIGRLIEATPKEVWHAGSYQVFLLSGPGNPAHRQLEAPIPHRTQGRGTAFTQRQRYVSLHALEIARTTEDLQ